MLDLTAQTTEITRLVAAVPEDALSSPTPCPGYDVAGLLAHLHGLSIAFADAARKVDGPTTRTPPDPTAVRLPDDWRTSLPAALTDLAAAWQTPGATEGATWAGGLGFPAEQALVVAADELVLHGWDLAVATGLAYSPDAEAVGAAHAMCAATPDHPSARQGLFGPVLEISPDAPLLDRTLGLAGRDPAWRP
ncbi:TIGR03086 family metal-binding protein [Auraticoccus monumenti]|uniref:TIGR03086 family protein n=1 Tax=Auraticoccus monumenti TaxID=675864 RepID=A0A1G6SR10_9ACTN|nr:TIGR03086 family metal-binding protein [Auraticoccus monumenti]SDD19041.1 TIGR03086 family protein [Auraticoccus monumenti]